MSVYVPVALQRRVRGTFEDRCGYCQSAEELSVATFEIEHIEPVSAGGQTVFENLCLACPACNRSKGDRITVLDPETNSQTPLFNPQANNWHDHFSWTEDGTELVAHTTIGRVTIAVLRMNRPALVSLRAIWVEVSRHPPAYLQ